MHSLGCFVPPTLSETALLNLPGVSKKAAPLPKNKLHGKSHEDVQNVVSRAILSQYYTSQVHTHAKFEDHVGTQGGASCLDKKIPAIGDAMCI
jgi:hypothetical protein